MSSVKAGSRNLGAGLVRAVRVPESARGVEHVADMLFENLELWEAAVARPTPHEVFSVRQHNPHAERARRGTRPECDLTQCALERDQQLGRGPRRAQPPPTTRAVFDAHARTDRAAGVCRGARAVYARLAGARGGRSTTRKRKKRVRR